MDNNLFEYLYATGQVDELFGLKEEADMDEESSLDSKENSDIKPQTKETIHAKKKDIRHKKY